MALITSDCVLNVAQNWMPGGVCYLYMTMEFWFISALALYWWLFPMLYRLIAPLSTNTAWAGLVAAWCALAWTFATKETNNPAHSTSMSSL